MKKLISLMFFMAVGMAAFAEPTVSDVVAKQRYPWNGLVDITCNVSGIEEGAEGLLFSASVVVPDSVTTKQLSHIQVMKDGESSTDLSVGANGNYRFLWDAKADLGEVRNPNMVVSLSITNPNVKDVATVQLWEGGPRWATMNIGAEKPEEYGYYFWWGDTVGYKWENSKWVASDGSNSEFSFEENNTPTYDKSTSTLKSEGWTTTSGVLAPEYDAAHVHWGAGWRMPTKEEVSALVSNCDRSRLTVNGISGLEFRGKGNYASVSIFIPGTGCGEGTTQHSTPSGYFWTSVPDSNWKGYMLYLASSGTSSYLSSSYRYRGLAIRPIKVASNSAMNMSLASGADSGGDSAPFLLDTMADPFITAPVAYDSSWVGGDSSAEVVVSVDGTEVNRMTGKGDLALTSLASGKRTLAYTTYINGIAQDEVYRATVFKDWKYVVANGKATISDLAQKSGSVTFPSAIDGYPVCGIADGVFSDCDIDCVTLPLSLTNLVASAINSFSQNDWTRDNAESGEVYRSNKITGSKTTEMTVTVKGPFEFSFDWKVSSEQNYDKLKWYLNGALQNEISGVKDWQKVTCSLPIGEHVIKWEYSKDYSVDKNSDCGWVRMHETEGMNFGGATVVYSDNPCSLGGDANWVNDDGGSLRSGAIADGESSWLDMKIVGEGTISFRWKSSSEMSDGEKLDYVSFQIDGTEYAWLGGETDWTDVVCDVIGTGEHTLRWVYQKNGNGTAAGEDCAWLDGLSWISGRMFRITYENLQGASHQNPSSYREGDSIEFTPPSAVSGYAFVGWTPSAITESDREDKVVTANWEWMPQDAVVDASITGWKPVTVKADWAKIELDRKFGEGRKEAYIAKFGVDFAASITKKTGKKDVDGNDLLVWHDYVAGTDPTDINSTFKAIIEMQDGKPVIRWEPNLNSKSEERAYTVYGKEKLVDAWHSPITVLDHFFKVDVDMLREGTVTFDVGGGSEMSPISVRVGQAVGELPTPVRDGYTFLGWFTAAEDGVAVTSEMVVTADMTIYARWEQDIILATVTFDVGGGSEISSISVRVGQAVGELPTPVRDGYTFLGWFTAAEGGVAVTSETVVTADMTIYARWEQDAPPVVVRAKVQLWEGGPYWATTNIGAENPEDYGYYFWWGDTVGYKRENNKWVASDGSNSNYYFNEGNTPTYNQSASSLKSKGWITADGVLTPEHDAAHVHWGDDWRMPTKEEIGNLVSKCTWTTVTKNGVAGFEVRGKGEYASNSIFLPMPGTAFDNQLLLPGQTFVYWSSTVEEDYGKYAWGLYYAPVEGNPYLLDQNYRWGGLPIRPVK